MYIYHNILAGVNALSEDGNLQFHQLVFRCGWATKNIHTAFGYIFNSENKDVLVVKYYQNGTNQTIKEKY